MILNNNLNNNIGRDIDVGNKVKMNAAALEMFSNMKSNTYPKMVFGEYTFGNFGPFHNF